MQESQTAFARRKDDAFWKEILVGKGLDVSGDSEIITQGFPGVVSVVAMREEQYLASRYFPPCVFDFVNSSDLIEHMNYVYTAILGWLYVLKVGGHLILTVPDEDLYEQNVWPSRWNSDHKCSYTILRKPRPHSKSVNIIDLLSRFPNVQVRRIQLADSGYDYTLRNTDQTLKSAEAHIEVVLRKMPPVVLEGKTYKHSGARGDLVYSLAAVKAFGSKAKLFINRSNGHHFHIPISDEELAGIAEFLKTQDYIESVSEWTGQEPDVDLDHTRKIERLEYYILSSTYLMCFGLQYDLAKPWIDPDKITPISKAEIVVSRTGRYHGVLDWGELAPWTDRCVFVGLEEEHAEFTRMTGLEIRRENTTSWKELAGVIRGCKLFVGNQSLAFSMAEAMKHPRVLEVCAYAPNCDPQGPNGHIRLTQGIIRKYLMGEECQDIMRWSRSPYKQITFKSGKPQQKRTYRDVSFVVVGQGESGNAYIQQAQKTGAETIWEAGDGSFEALANSGAAKASRQIICVIDTKRCTDFSIVVSVVDLMMDMKTGFSGPSFSSVGRSHISGACLCVSRQVYQRLGLFNPAMCPGELSFLELHMRYAQQRIVGRCAGIQEMPVERVPEFDDRNRKYLQAMYGLEL